MAWIDQDGWLLEAQSRAKFNGNGCSEHKNAENEDKNQFGEKQINPGYKINGTH